jgi:hypothetical protein
MRARPIAVACACALGGCSFIAVRGPVHSHAATPIQDPSLIRCTDSAVLPSLDAVTGSLGVGAALFGGIVDQTSAHTDLPDHYTRDFAGPLLAIGIAYLWSASFGTDRVEACVDAKAAVIPKAVVVPIDMTGVTPPDPDSGN